MNKYSLQDNLGEVVIAQDLLKYIPLNELFSWLRSYDEILKFSPEGVPALTLPDVRLPSGVMRIRQFREARGLSTVVFRASLASIV